MTEAGIDVTPGLEPDDDHPIEILEGVEHIRLRPGLYVYDIETPEIQVKEPIDNSIDEIQNGFGDWLNIEVTTLADGNHGYLIQDNCGGLPLKRMPKFDNQPIAKLLFLKTFSGGKFNNKRYKYSGGTYGLGLTVVNALSRKLVVDVNDRTGSQIYHLEFSNGELTDEQWIPYTDSPKYSTSIYMEPDPKIYKSTKCKINTIPMKLVALLGKADVYLNGSLIEPFDPKKEIDESVLGDYIVVNLEKDPVTIQAFFSWSGTQWNEYSRGTVNVTPCQEGFHLQEMRRCIGKVLASKSDLINVSDAGYGLRQFVGFFTTAPVFSGQAKHRLSWPQDWTEDHSKALIDACKEAMDKSPVLIETVINRIVEYKKKLQELSDSQFVSSVVIKGHDKRSKGVGAGIYDCTTPDRMKAELFIVEGKSAAGNLLQVRDKILQAVLPLRGKTLNVVNTNDIKIILNNPEIVALVNSIGIGIHPDEDVKQSRYGKAILTTDADPDGSHIGALLTGALTFLTPSLIDGGMLYVARAPLYLQDGKYLWDESELNKSRTYKHFKGLGSMTPKQLYDSVVNPATRRLLQVRMDDKSLILETVNSSRERRAIMLKSGIIQEKLLKYEHLI